MEQRLRTTSDPSQISNWTIADFLRKLSSEEPVPGGGSVAALSGALAAALIVMYTKIGVLRKGISGDDQEVLQKVNIEASTYLQKLNRLITEDSNAYSEVMEAFKLSKSTDDEKKARQTAIQRAFLKAIDAPMQTLSACIECLYLIAEAAPFGNASAFSDLKVAEYLCDAGAKGALENIDINLSSIKDPEIAKQITAQVEKLKQSLESAKKQKIEMPA